MYKEIDKMPKTYDDERFGLPLVVLEDEYGGQSIIGIDDHCFVLRNKGLDDQWNIASHWYPEAAYALVDFLIENPNFKP